MNKHTPAKRILLLISASVSFALLFVCLARRIRSGNKAAARIAAIDGRVREFFTRSRMTGVTAFFRLFTKAAYSVTISCTAFFAFIISLIIKKHRSAFFFGGLCMFFSAWTTFFLKINLKRERPGGEKLIDSSDYAFPSGHTMSAAAYYGFLAIYFAEVGNIFISAVCFLMVLLTGIARMYLGVHAFSDIAGGLLEGFSLAFLFSALREKAISIIKAGRAG